MREGMTVLPYPVDRAAIAAETEAILHHAAFSEAIERYAAAGLGRFDGDPRAAKMVCQVSRYTLALAILHLDATAGPDGPGATASRLRAMLTKGDFASVGWVKNAVGVFRRAGYLEEAPTPGDRRLKRVVPSEAMIGIAQEALTPMLHAVDGVAPLPLPLIAKTPRHR